MVSTIPMVQVKIESTNKITTPFNNAPSIILTPKKQELFEDEDTPQRLGDLCTPFQPKNRHIVDLCTPCQPGKYIIDLCTPNSQDQVVDLVTPSVSLITSRFSSEEVEIFVDAPSKVIRTKINQIKKRKR